MHICVVFFYVDIFLLLLKPLKSYTCLLILRTTEICSKHGLFEPLRLIIMPDQGIIGLPFQSLGWLGGVNVSCIFYVCHQLILA